MPINNMVDHMFLQMLRKFICVRVKLLVRYTFLFLSLKYMQAFYWSILVIPQYCTHWEYFRTVMPYVRNTFQVISREWCWVEYIQCEWVQQVTWGDYLFTLPCIVMHSNNTYMCDQGFTHQIRKSIKPSQNHYT